MADESTPLRIDSRQLETRKIKAAHDNQAYLSKLEAELRERWLALFMPEYIENKIIEARITQTVYIELIKEETVPGIDYSRINEECTKFVNQLLPRGYEAHSLVTLEYINIWIQNCLLADNCSYPGSDREIITTTILLSGLFAILYFIVYLFYRG